MNYMMIRTDDMLNGEGLRVVLFCTACDHCCKNCHNPETWQASNGKFFDDNAKLQIFNELEKEYISGLTISGGDPLNINNLKDVCNLCEEVKEKYPDKTIWLYTGFTWEDIIEEINAWHQDELTLSQIIKNIDVLVDGKFVQELADVKYPWAGSTNQKVIDVKKSLEQNEVVLWCD